MVTDVNENVTTADWRLSQNHLDEIGDDAVTLRVMAGLVPAIHVFLFRSL